MEKINAPLAFLDVETTGLSAKFDDRVCEIAILKCEPNGILTSWSSLINPKKPISEGASLVNGISNEMVANAPFFEDIAQRVIKYLENSILVCHNAPFDVSFISYELGLCGIDFPRIDIIDTLRIARSYFEFPSNSLQNIASYIEFYPNVKHRALADVYTTYEIFKYMWQELESKGVEKIEDIFFSNIQSRKNFERVNSFSPKIEKAMKDNKKVSFIYSSRFGNKTKRVVEPLELVKIQDFLYLIGICNVKNEERYFRIDRMANLQVL